MPTGAALIFLRPYPRFWTVLATLALVVALTGLAAAVLFAVGHDAVPPSRLATFAQFSVLRILVAPVLAFTFLVCTALSPWRPQRLALMAATLMEAAVSAYGMWIWFVPMLLHR